MKYIMFAKPMAKNKTTTHVVPIIFPDSLAHADVAAAMVNGPLKGYMPRSAGEWNPMHGCSGRSSTLNMNSDPRDTRIVLLNDYGAAWECT